LDVLTGFHYLPHSFSSKYMRLSSVKTKTIHVGDSQPSKLYYI
jgi:hypothetical protein